MMTTATKSRRKFRFSDRETAEREQLAASIQSSRCYFVAIAYRAKDELRMFRRGSYSAEIVVNHAITGRALSMGPIAVLTDHSSEGCPQILDAWEWAHETATRNVTPSDQDGYDYRDLALAVLAYIRSEML
jgi:hypothetical protein